MKTIYLLICLIIVSSSGVLAQETANSIKFAEITVSGKSQKALNSELTAKIKNLADAIREKPLLTYSFVFYGRKSNVAKLIGKVSDLIGDFAPAHYRIEFIYGGYRKRLRVEIWRSPRGAGPPPLESPKNPKS